MQPIDLLALQIRALGLPEPEREFCAVPGRKFRTDFAWPAQKVAVEYEGGTWSGGGHNRGGRFHRDVSKYNELAILGWKVIRVTADTLRDGSGVEYARRALEE